MSRDSGSEHPSQRTVAELLAQHGGGSQRSARRRRRRAEDPTDTAPQAIIERVNSDSGRMRPVPPQDETAQPENGQSPRGGSAAPEAEVEAPPAQSPSTAPPPDTAPRAPAAEPRASEDPNPSRAAGFLARRFTRGGNNGAGNNGAGNNGAGNNGAGTAPSSRSGAAAESAPADIEITAQQPTVSDRPEPPRVSTPPAPSDNSAMRTPSPPPATGAAGHDGGETAVPTRFGNESTTEQFPSVHGTVQRESGGNDGEWGATATVGGTAMPLPQETGELAEPGDVYPDAYADPDDEEDGSGEQYLFGTAGLDEDDPDGEFGGRYFRDTSTELPAGMDAEDYLDGEFDAEDERSRHSPLREWLTLITQVGAGLLGGGAVWVGFRWLWTTIPVAALVAALAVTGALVLIARRFLRTDDLQTVLLAVLVGLVCAVSPAALLLVGY